MIPVGCSSRSITTRHRRRTERAPFMTRIRDFATQHGATVFEVGEGISHQVVVERGLVAAGDLVIGADSHTVMCGALNCFAIGVGSSDLAAAMKTGRIWLRVPETILVRLEGERRPGVAAKDVALEIVARLGSDGANYQAIEFAGDLDGVQSRRPPGPEQPGRRRRRQGGDLSPRREHVGVPAPTRR